MITYNDLEIGCAIQHEKSGTTWIILAIYDGMNREVLSGTPLIMVVDVVPRAPYIVMAGFSVKHRCDDGLATECSITSKFLEKYTRLDIPLVNHYNDMTFD